MTLQEEFLRFLAEKGIQFSPCAFSESENIPPREEWEDFANKWLDAFSKLFEDKELFE